MTTFNELNISSEVKRAVEEMGYENATDIQARAIPCILEGKDVLGRSNTGTGKTAAFGIPAIEMVNPGCKYCFDYLSNKRAGNTGRYRIKKVFQI